MTASEESHDRFTIEQRLSRLERDDVDHARIITEMVKAGQSFTDEQVAQIRAVFREELSDAGLRIDGDEHQDAAREDFRFLRRLRLSWDGGVNKIGNAVLIAILGIAGTIIGMGFWAWLSSQLGKQ